MEKTMPMWQRYMELAQGPLKEEYEGMIKACGQNPGWADCQRVFLAWMDKYLSEELEKPIGLNIGAHEAGGQFRVAFAHQLVRGRDDVFAYMEKMMEARKAFTNENQFHGYVDCHEIHHEIETYLYFQNPMALLGFPGKDVALSSILDVAEHTGSWVPGVPAWYDWATHSFVSVYLGTKAVKDYPPHDYQEANHFRFLNMAAVAYSFTKEQRYLDLINDYCVRWCEHIESFPPEGPIPCSILPKDAEFVEMNYAGKFKETGKYQIFYATVAENTMFDIVVGFFNAYRLTGNRRYLAAGEKMMEQFILNGDGIRPASRFSGGKWSVRGERQEAEELDPRGFFGGNSMIPHLAVLYTQITGDLKYRDFILKWAADIDEDKNSYDQTAITLLCAAHYFDGNPAWLERATKMALRAYPFSEGDDEFHQCNSTKRQGSKNSYLPLYSAMLGDADFATRGSLPSSVLRYHTAGKIGLDKDIAIRVWLRGPGEYGFEAKNMGGKDISFDVSGADGKTVSVRTEGASSEGRVLLPAGASLCGAFLLC